MKPGRAAKLLTGLAATLLMGWVWHGPLGHGEALVGALEAQARAAVAEEDLPGIAVTLDHDPLSRRATLSGPANDFQRNGMGSLPGLTGKVAGVEGISAVRWADEPDASRAGLPLLAETLALVAAAFAVAVGLAWLLWGRPKRESYL
jgi:hypothetical protein